jgi:hypothetical protein
MMRLVVLVALGLILSSCGSSRAALPSSLQRYQSLSTDLAGVTAISSSTSQAVLSLSSAVRRGDDAGTRSVAGHVRYDAMQLAARSGSAAASIRRIVRGEKSRIRAEYFRLVLAALSYQWAEAQSLSALSQLVWWDPYLTGPGATRKLGRLSADAQWEAWKSVLSAAAAQRWRATHRRYFRYIPVGTAGHVAAGPWQ